MSVKGKNISKVRELANKSRFAEELEAFDDIWHDDRENASKYPKGYEPEEGTSHSGSQSFRDDDQRRLGGYESCR